MRRNGRNGWRFIIMVMAMMMVGCASRQAGASSDPRPEYARVLVDNVTDRAVLVYVTLNPSRISARRLGRVEAGKQRTFEVRMKVRESAYLDVRFVDGSFPPLMRPLPLWRADRFTAKIGATHTDMWIVW